MTYEQLMQQKREISDALDKLRVIALADVRTAVGRYQFTTEEVFCAADPAVESPAEVREPVATGPAGEKWYGRGRKPAWLLAQEAAQMPAPGADLARAPGVDGEPDDAPETAAETEGGEA